MQWPMNRRNLKHITDLTSNIKVVQSVGWLSEESLAILTGSVTLKYGFELPK